MDNIDKLLYRILLGYYYIIINDIKFKIKYPSLDVKYEAEVLYDEIIENNKFDKRWLTQKEIDFYLNINNVWNNNKNKELENLEKGLEKIKIQLYLNFFNKDKRKYFKTEIAKLNKNISKMVSIKNSYSWLGIEDHALSIKNEFIIMNSIYTIEDKLVFNNPNLDTYEYKQLQIFISEIIDYTININHIKKIAKSDLWKSYANTTNIEKSINNINDDYRHLINTHKMYENAKQHPEAPSEEIIDDDDALDGWFLYQSEKIEKEKKKNTILNKVGGNIKNAGEVFVLTDNQDEAKSIFALNEGSAIIEYNELKNASKQIQEKGESVKWQDLSFTKRKLQEQISQHNSKDK